MAGEILWEDGDIMLWEDGASILWEDAVVDGGEGEPPPDDSLDYPSYINEDGSVFVDEDGTTPFVGEDASILGERVGPITCLRSISTITCYFYRRW